MMRLRSPARLVSFGLSLSLAAGSTVPLQAQGRTIDEGTFVVTVAGKPAGTENFKIAHGDNGLINGTGQISQGTRQITSVLVTDSLGTPLRYDVAIRENGVQTLKVMVAAVGGRLTASSSNQRGDESMHEYRLAPGRSVILEDGILHQLYFLGLAKHPGGVEAIAPRESRSFRMSLAAQGLEPIQVAGRTLTATHYVLGDGAARHDFWLDANGKLLRVELPSRQLVAVREEPPK